MFKLLIPLLLLAPAGTLVAAEPLRVPTLTVQDSAQAAQIWLDGVVQPVRQSQVAAQAQGRVLTRTVKAGDAVRAGQLMFTIDDREALAGVQASGARVAQAEAELAQARLSLERQRALQRQGFVSQAALDAAQTQVQSALAARDQASAGAGQSRLAQGFTRVTAPYDGYVRETLAEPGDLALPGKPLASVYAPDRLRVAVQLPLTRQTVGKPEIELPGGEWLTPTQTQLMPAADAASQTVEWRLDLPPGASARLTPGQQLRVRVTGAGTLSRLVLPESAVLRRGELNAVYVAAESGFRLRAVRLGAARPGLGIEVLAGLRSGERVARDAVRAGLEGAQP